MIHNSSCSLHVGLGLLGSTGGTTQAVADFQRAMEPSLVTAICDGDSLAKEGPYRKDWIYLKSRQSFLGQLYHTVEKSTEAQFMLKLPTVSSVFCHMLYRYNTNFVAHIGKSRDVPYFVVPHGSLDPWVFTYRSWQKKSWLAFYGRTFLRNAAAVIFATEAEKRKASEVVSVNNGVVIHWPVDVSFENISRERRAEIRKSLGIPPIARVLLMFGRVHSSKRPLETLRAIAAAANSNLHVIVVGPPNDISREECERAAGVLGNRMHWIGPAYGEAKWDYLSAVDGYITLSSKENFNYCLAESLGAGLPVIVSPGNDLAVELSKVECGWMLRDSDEETAVRAIREFCGASEQALQKMGDNGRRFAIRELARDVFEQKLNALVETHKRRNLHL